MEREDRELVVIGSLSRETEDTIFSVLNNSGHQILPPEQMVALLSDAVSTDVAGSLVGSLLRLHQVSSRTESSISNLIELRKIRIDLADDYRSEKVRGLDVIERLAAVPTVRLAARAIDLSYESDNLLQRSRVLTDIRPIFSEDAGSIDGAVVAHTLRLRYDSAGLDREISLAVDSNDLRKLIFQCERALLKEETSQMQMIEKADITTTPRQSNDIYE